MDALKQWCVCLIVAAAAGTFATVVAPKGSMDKTVRAIIGIFVVSVICAPLTEIKKTDFSFKAFADYDFEYENTSELEDVMISACKAAIEKSIKDESEAFGVHPDSVETQLSVDGENCIIIHKIAIKLSDSSEKINSDLSVKLEEKLGVPVEIE